MVSKRSLIGLFLCVCVAGSVSAGCDRRDDGASEASPAPVPRSTVSPPAATAWQAMTNLAGPSGEHNVRMALQAFAMTYGPLPGATVPDGAAAPVHSTSAADRLIMAHWAELTGPQQTAVEDVSGLTSAPPVGRSGRSAPISRARAGTCPTSRAYTTHPASADITKTTDGLYRQLAAKLPTAVRSVDATAPINIVLCESDRDLPVNAAGERPLGGTRPSFNGSAVDCPITVFPSSRGPGLPTTIAHELTHCFVMRLSGSLQRDYALPMWINEGFAEWAGLEIGRGSSTWWPVALDPRLSLMRRSYDAVGFFAHLRDTDNDVWQMIPAIISAASGKGVTDGFAAFEVALGNNRDRVLNTLPSSYARQPGRGRTSGTGPWDLNGHNIFGFANSDKNLALREDGPDSTIQLAWQPFASRLSEIYLHAEVVTFVAQSADSVYGRFGPGQGGDYVLSDAVTKTFCTKEGGCSCKDDPAPTTFTQIDGGVALLATYEVPPALQGRSLEDFCKKKRPVKVQTGGCGPNNVAPGSYRERQEAKAPGAKSGVPTILTVYAVLDAKVDGEGAVTGMMTWGEAGEDGTLTEEAYYRLGGTVQAPRIIPDGIWVVDVGKKPHPLRGLDVTGPAMTGDCEHLRWAKVPYMNLPRTNAADLPVTFNAPRAR